MAKSMRSKRKKRLRSLRREIAECFYEKKESAKLAVQEAALAAPKLPVPENERGQAEPSTVMDVEMADGGTSHGDDSRSLLKPTGGVGKKLLKKKLQLKKLKKLNRRGKGKGKIRHRKI
ncbi:hypothetical protein HPP92_012766 [Vanilla planifolia]|uniref:Uncharacterized protein n=1 Tax=Vanilla planifolia TaxID=51239 RepID=A0A835R274_VANPL|nr:hypothetical protein HPP92_013198 [Vanilla planifolia]KAG0478047.1 hypothetical protein HPP92_012766 [Vanilla planifolia]